MSGNPNMRPAGYRSKFGTTATTARQYWNIYCFAIAIGFHLAASDKSLGVCGCYGLLAG